MNGHDSFPKQCIPHVSYECPVILAKRKMHSTRLKDKPARGRDDDVTMTEPNFTRRPHTINKHVGNCSVAVLLRLTVQKKKKLT